MTSTNRFRLDRAVLPNGEARLVIVDDDDRLHIASSWLMTLADLRRSPNTIESYGRRVTAYLNWTTPLADWRAVRIAHLVLWRRALEASGKLLPRTVDINFVALRSFYEWADSRDLVTSQVVGQMTEMRYFAPGAAGGGEHGAYRRVTSARLRGSTRGRDAPDLEWLSDPGARDRLERLDLPPRDRFLIDIMYFTGIRAGEALSLFTADMHLGGGTRSSGCMIRDPHFHVRMTNPVTNGARAKGRERTLYTNQHLVDGYIDYLIDRDAILGENDHSAHMLVNLYGRPPWLGEAMKYDGVLRLVKRCGREIGFPMAGPHLLRHTFATRLARGIDCEQQPQTVVQELLGHRSAASTRTYMHDFEGAKLKALMALPSRRADLGED